MNKVKQAILTVLIACFMAGIVYMLNPIQAYALTYAEGDTWIDTSGNMMSAEEAGQWEYHNDLGINLSGYKGQIVDGQIVGKVPAIIKGKKVTEMNSTFSECTNLVQAPVIPDSVQNMSYTFSGCTSLTQAPVIPDSVQIMAYTFTNCTNLAQAPVIPNSVGSMTFAFANCQQLYGKVELPEAMKARFKNIFFGCTASITGTVADRNGTPVSEATITVNDTTTTTDMNGAFTITGLDQVGTYTINVTASGYETKEQEVTLIRYENGVQNFRLRLEGDDSVGQNVTGTITDIQTSTPLSNAQVVVKNPEGNIVETTITSEIGNYEITDLPAGNYTLEVSYEEVSKTQSFTITNKDEVVDLALEITTEVPDPDVPLGPGNVVNGTTNGNLPIYGTVNPINMIDVTLPITMSFVIKADRTLQKPQDIQIKSNCPAPLDTKILSINKSTTAPELAAPTKYTDDQWNNLTRAQTYKEIGLALNGYDLSAPGNSIGNLKSAFNEADPSNPNTQQLALDLDAKYGKAWDNSEDYTFTYNVVFEFSML